MRKFLSLLLLYTATMMGWSSAYAQTDEEYEAALAAIEDGSAYRIKTDVEGVAYYLTTNGTLTATVDDAGVFVLNQVAGGAYQEYAYLVDGGGTRFSNPASSSSIDDAKLNVSTNNRVDWEAQVFFLNENGKYAVRATNAEEPDPDATSGWNWCGSSFWTVKDADTDPKAGYSFDVNYIWELEFMFDADAIEAKQAAYEKVQGWIPAIQSAKGLVQDADKFYSNAKDSGEGSYANLLDGNYTTFFHSSYHNDAPNEDHYLQAELKEATQNIRFYYKKRSQNNNNRPTTIVISASNDGTEFTEIQTIKSGLPTSESVIDYLSDAIDLGAKYKYVRFTVTETNNGQVNSYVGHVFFTFSEFYVLPEIAETETAYTMFKENKPAFELDPDQVANVDAALTAALNTVTVTYILCDSDGTEVTRKDVVQEGGSDVKIPADFINKFYDYEVTGTIGDEDCEIIITRSYKAGLVLSQYDLSNDKCYYIYCDRGAFLASDGYMKSTALGALKDAEPTKFAIINFENLYYLYSVEEGKFVINTGALTDNFMTEVNGDEDAIIMEDMDIPYIFWRFNKDNAYINTNGNAPLGYVINSYSSPDPGNQYYMFEAGEFDPTEPLNILENYFYPSYVVTYIVKDEDGNELFDSGPLATAEGMKITTLPAEYQRTFYTYNEVDVTIEDLETTVEFTATWNGPFKLSTDYANAYWQNMAMRGTWYVTTEYQDGDGAYQTQNANTMGLVEDSYQWAFIGDAYNGFKIINKAEGNGMSLGWTDSNQTNQGIPTMMDDNTGYHFWNIVPSTNTTVPAGSFCLNVPGTNLYINQYGGAGGSVKFWDSTNNISDPGSAFTVFDVPDNFAEFVANEIAPKIEATGYFTFTDEAKADIGYDESKKFECSFEDYRDMKENLEAIEWDISNYILPETGLYILQNKYYGNFMGMDPSDANMYGDYKHAKEAKHIVKLTKIDDETYTISIMGKYAPAVVERSQPVKACEEGEEGYYTISIPSVGYAAFQADQGDEYSCLHRRAEGDLVGWVASADATQWAAYDATGIQLTIGAEGYDTACLPFDVKPLGDEMPEPLGVWTFDDGTTANTVGDEQEIFLFESDVTFADGKVMVPASERLQMQMNLETSVLTNYTVMMDVKLLADKETDDELDNFSALIQNKLDHSDDASIFFKYDTDTHKRGIGRGSYAGDISLDTWYRIVIATEDNIPTIYVNGIKGAELDATTATDKAKNYQLSNGIIFFQDNDGEENDIVCDEIRFWDSALTPSQVAELGTYGGGAVVAVKVPEAAGTWTFDDANNLLKGTGSASLESATHAKNSVNITDVTSAGIVATEGPAEGNGAVTVPVGSSLVMTPAGSNLQTYSFMMDIKAEDVNGFVALFSNKVNNEGDGSFFIKNGQVGINAGGLGYNGTIAANAWTRVVFVVDNLYAKVFINGTKVGESTGQVAQHWALGSRALFFADEDGEEKTVSTSEIRFWEEALSAEQVELLGVAGSNPAEVADDMEGIKVYTGKISTSIAACLEMTELTGGIPANTGVVLKGKPGAHKFAITTDLEPVTDNDLKGTLKPIEEAAGLYVLNKPAGNYAGFYKASSIAAGKAYLEYTGTPDYNDFLCLFDDEPDAIKGVEGSTTNVENEDGFIYNLAGQRISKMQKGINIMSGKKYIVK